MTSPPRSRNPRRRPGGPPLTPGFPGTPGNSPPVLPLGLLAPPAIPLFPMGYLPQASDFGTWVRNSLGFCTQGICFRARQTTPQTIATSGTHVLAFDTIDEDPYGGWSPPNLWWHAPYTGWYDITVLVTSQPQNFFLGAAMNVNSGTSVVGDYNQVTSGNTGGAICAWSVPLIGGADYVQAQSLSSAGYTTDTPNPGRYTSFEITFASE